MTASIDDQSILDLQNKVVTLFQKFNLGFYEGIALLLQKDLHIESLESNDEDYKTIEAARKRREDGEQSYDLDEILKEFDAH